VGTNITQYTIIELYYSPFLSSSYVGQVVDGLRDGWGCYKCAGSHVTYTGSWKNGKRNGKVSIINPLTS